MGNAFLNSYDVMAKEGLAANEVGARALQKAASEMKRCLRVRQTSGEWGDHEQLMNALHKNQRLWTILQVECTSPESALEPSLKRNLFQLSQFVDKSTFQFIADQDPTKLEALVRINESLVEGMTAEAAPRAPATVQPPQALALSLSF